MSCDVCEQLSWHSSLSLSWHHAFNTATISYMDHQRPPRTGIRMRKCPVMLIKITRRHAHITLKLIRSQSDTESDTRFWYSCFEIHQCAINLYNLRQKTKYFRSQARQTEFEDYLLLILIAEAKFKFVAINCWFYTSVNKSVVYFYLSFKCIIYSPLTRPRSI